MIVRCNYFGLKVNFCPPMLASNIERRPTVSCIMLLEPMAVPRSKDGAVASSTADDDSAFGDFGKDGVAISRAKEGVDARIGRLERLDRIARLLFVGRIRTGYGATNHEDWQARYDKT